MRAAGLLLITLLPCFAQDYTVAVLSRQVLTNESIVKLAKAGFDETFIIDRIHASRTDFDTSIEGLIALKQAGISTDLIRVIAGEDLRKRPAQNEDSPAETVKPGKSAGKSWWGLRWVRALTSR